MDCAGCKPGSFFCPALLSECVRGDLLMYTASLQMVTISCPLAAGIGQTFFEMTLFSDCANPTVL